MSRPAPGTVEAVEGGCHHHRHEGRGRKTPLVRPGEHQLSRCKRTVDGLQTARCMVDGDRRVVVDGGRRFDRWTGVNGSAVEGNLEGFPAA